MLIRANKQLAYVVRLGCRRQEARSTEICILAVPGHVPVSELCAFLSGLLGHVRKMRIVRDVASDAWYTVLVTFDTQDSADDCYRSLSGRPVRPSSSSSSSSSYSHRVLFLLFSVSLHLEVGRSLDAGLSVRMSTRGDACSSHPPGA